MKTLYIVRHAKSSWEYEGIKDIDRPLKKRGIEDAYLISTVLEKKIKCPSVFVSSCANRALHTALIFSYSFNFPLANIKISKSLYSFSDGYLIKTIKALDDGYRQSEIAKYLNISMIIQRDKERQATRQQLQDEINILRLNHIPYSPFHYN